MGQNNVSYIPKIIHYCWFGGNPKNKLIKKCIKSWKKYLPDYKFREWNDKDLVNCKNEYALCAYRAKKYAFVSDYFRLYALYNFGGIYFDTDNEIFKPFDEFLDLDFFSGYEKWEEEYFPFTAVVGAKKGNKIIKDLLDEYDDIQFINPDGSLNLYTNTRRVMDYFQRRYNFLPPYDGTCKENLEDKSIIFPSNIFCHYEKDVSYAVHHFNYSWKEKTRGNNLFQKIFSVKNECTNDIKRKVVTVFGFRIKFSNYKTLFYKKQKEASRLSKQLDYLKRHTDITALKPAEGKLRERQLELIDTCQEFFVLIEKINIKPFLYAGALIGHIRHNGFIPWDDDIDFGLMREDYDKLINFCKENIDVEIYNGSIYEYKEKEFKKYLCEKYKNKFVLTIWHNQLQVFKGVDMEHFNYIDFFPFDFYDDNYSFKEHKEYLMSILENKRKIRNNLQIIKFLDNERVLNKNIKNLSGNIYFGIDNMDSWSKLKLNNSFMPYNTIFPLKPVSFEGIDCYAANNSEKFLAYQCENFMEFPLDIGIEKHDYLRN